MSENIFDDLKANTFDVITQTMGYDAVWYHESIEEEGIKARVLFNDPSEKEEVAEHDYSYARPTIEYRKGVWNELKAATDRKQNTVVYVKQRYYYVLKVIGIKGTDSAVDGETYKAVLQEAKDIA